MFVEWPEAGAGMLPPPTVRIVIDDAGDGRRAIAIEARIARYDSVPMRVLALDTATDRATAAVVDGATVVERGHEARGASGARRAGARRRRAGRGRARAARPGRHRGRRRPGILHGPADRDRDRRGPRRRRGPGGGRRVDPAGAPAPRAGRCGGGAGCAPPRGVRRGARRDRRRLRPGRPGGAAARGHHRASATARCGTATTFADAGLRVPDDPAVHAVRADAHAALARFDGTRPVPLYLREPDATPAAVAR